MESVDGARSLNAASEEIVENLCDPCKYDGLEKEGPHFCTDCEEYFCQACKDSHKRFKNSRNHTFLPRQADPNVKVDSKAVRFTVTCSCEHNSEANIYCENHDEVICQTCKAVKHRKCTTDSVQDKSAAYVVSKLNSVIQNAQSMRDEIKKFQQDRENDMKTLSIMSEKCKKEIQSFRQELDTLLSLLEQNILSDLEKFAKQEQNDIEFHISSCSTPLNLLDVDSKLLEDANNTGEKDKMFASDVKVSNHLKDFQSMLQDFQKEAKSAVFEFETDQKVIDVKKEIKTLGKIKVNKMRYNEPDKQSMLDMKVGSSLQTDIKLSDDQSTPWISGCIFMSDGHLVLCDRGNYNIKLLSSNFEIKETISLPRWPFDVSIVDSATVITTIPMSKMLQYIQVFPSLQTRRLVQLDKQCWGIVVADGTIYTTCHDGPGNMELRVLDMNCNLIRKICPSPSITFKSPSYLAFSATSKMIYISDWRTSTITCLSPQGKITYQYSDADLKTSKGVYVDDKGTLTACGGDSKNIHLVNSDGKKYSILVKSKDYTDQDFCSLAFRQSDSTLVVGCHGSKLLVLKLTK